MELSKYDLSALAESGYEFEVTHPDTGDGLGGFITVRGTRSKIVEQYNRKIANEQIRAENAQKVKGKEKVRTVEELIDDLNKMAAIRVISWRNITDQGVELEFSREKAVELFEKYDWIRTQVMEASNESEKFRSGND
jgi:hypothetical protein